MHYGIDPRKNGDDRRLFRARTPAGDERRLFRSANQSCVQRPFSQTLQSQAFATSSMTNTQFIGRQISRVPQASGSDIERRYEIVENMLHNLKLQPLHSSLEQAIQQIMNASTCHVWLDNHSMSALTSTSAAKNCEYQKGIVGLVYREKKMLLVPVPSQHEVYDPYVDVGDASTIYFPLETQEGVVVGVAQVMRSPDWIPFNDGDESGAVFFKERFAQIAHLIISDWEEKTLVSSITQRNTNANMLEKMIERLTRHFHCRAAEFWQLEDVGGAISKFVPEKGFVNQSNKMAGAVGQALKAGMPVNIVDITKAQGFSVEADGSIPDSVLFVPIHHNSQTIAIVVRGKLGAKAFSAVDMMQLESIAPVMTKAVVSGQISTDDGLSDSDFALRLKALLEVAEVLSGVLDIDMLIKISMSRACSLLSTERCSLFLVDTVKQELVTRFHGGLDKSIRLPLNRGFVGHTATTGEIVNITDAYSDPRFDKGVDLATGFKTKTILTVPIYNNRGEIAGVTEMINRIDGSAFDEEDIKMMMAFNVFCGISLDNAKLYQSSLDLTRQLRGFVEMSSALNKTKTVRDVLEEILEKTKDVINATRGTIFLSQSDVLKQFVNTGNDPIHGTIFADEVCHDGKAKLFTKDDIIAKLASSNIQDNDDEKPSGSRISSALSEAGGLLLSSNRSHGDLPQFEPICAFPLTGSDGKILGVMELSCGGKILPEDMKLLDCYAVFAAVSLEKSELQEIAKFGHMETELKKYIADNERRTYDIPVELQIPEKDQATVFSINFDAPLWEGIGLFKVIWRIYKRFNILEDFKVTNETFFRFIMKLSETYKPVPYHNWRHAVDVTQFLTFEILTGKLDEVLPKFELFGLLVAAVCHDANHDGFTNVFNVKAETPLGILFKNQSVMETHHCSMAIGIISKAECNIFASLTAQEYKKMWTLIIQLILITDMAKHFDFLKAANALMDEGPLDMQNEQHRLTLMQLILKCGDVSNVSRPFELADKWCDVLCEEFFRQGDLEMASGMEYTSPLNDREHLDKPKSQIGFYNFVCLPLFQTAARAVPPLECNCEQIRSNLAVWKAASEAKAKEEEAAKAKEEAAKAAEEKKE